MTPQELWALPAGAIRARVSGDMVVSCQFCDDPGPDRCGGPPGRSPTIVPCTTCRCRRTPRSRRQRPPEPAGGHAITGAGARYDRMSQTAPPRTGGRREESDGGDPRSIPAAAVTDPGGSR
ncbi:hypothetical protein GJR88_01985 [Dietzia sp. DQ12-45-1b]|nr:hypothetical protein GJR88_01985 [Dietzia sp. DQ12-45-1b]